MSLLVQHGFGKGEKIETALREGIVEGVIMSPRDEPPERLSAYLEHTAERYPHSLRLMDPQVYASTLPPLRDGFLQRYPYYRPNLSRRDCVGTSAINRLVKPAIEYQLSLNTTAILSPTVLVKSLTDHWSQVALEMAAASIECHAKTNSKKKLLISVAIHESAVARREDVDHLLDFLTTLDVHGFYLLCERSSVGGTALIDPQTLFTCMYMAYALRVINEYEVYCGYSDWIAIPLAAAGATGCACGWFQSLRMFSLGRFQPAGGGRQPKARYSSGPLLNSVLFDDLDQVFRLGMIESVLSKTRRDRELRNRPPNEVELVWGASESALHHWEVLSNLINELAPLTVQDALGRLDEYLDTAEGLYTATAANGVVWDTRNDGRHIAQWRSAVQQLRQVVGL